MKKRPHVRKSWHHSPIDYRIVPAKELCYATQHDLEKMEAAFETRFTRIENTLNEILKRLPPLET